MSSGGFSFSTRRNLFRQARDLAIEMKNAVLCFIVKNGKTLLIRKKRGFGQGKLIAPGGRIESGETPEDAAVREFEEETGIRVKNPEKIAEIEFYFDGKKEWLVH